MCGVAAPDVIWRPDVAIGLPRGHGKPIHRPDIFETIDSRINNLEKELKGLSLDIHDHPELKWEEYHAHDVLTDFMQKQGFEVEKQYLFPTAWKATYINGSGGRTIGVNSEMDALPGVGHGCGHNLIAIAGVAVACAIKAAMEQYNISGKVVLLGTPAEEGVEGKIPLLEKGAYKGMDACVMCHPAPGPPHSASLSSSLALQIAQVEFAGRTAHAALAPWEGQNALDAAVAAYTNIGLLRQQLQPNHRVHGIIEGRDWAANVIPDNAKMSFYVRCKTWDEVLAATPRVINCFEAAALATACKVDIQITSKVKELRQNKALGDEFARIWESKYGPVDYKYGIDSASTDFGDVTYALPALHPGFGIPTVINGGNHTRAFAESATTEESHTAALNVSRALAAVSVRLLIDDEFFSEVRSTFEADKRLRGDA